MRFWASRFRAYAAVILGLLAFGTDVFAQTAPAAQGFRLGDHGQTTRLVLDLTQEAPYQVRTLAGPDRIVIDFPGLEWRLATPLPKKGMGLIRSVYKEGGQSLVLELTRPAKPSKVFYLAPAQGTSWRFVMDLEPSSAKESPKAARADLQSKPVQAPTLGAKPGGKPTASASASPSPAPASPPPVKAIPVIALDPGHGGIDPGAIGASGVYEKNITLAMARELKERIEASGHFKAMLTRDRDVFLKLRDRVAKARAAGADLFISLHADAHGNEQLSGLSVYTLSEKASDAEAELLAEKENKADLIAGIDLSHEAPEVANILIDLAQRETMNLSASFAGKTVAELGRQVKLLSNTHRFAGFAVLKAPDVPSVLLELGYLSNPREEQLLKTEAYRAKLSQAVVKALDAYFDQLRKAGPP
ncbi:MAG: N-acetylmuramoyl-L-alanine amidase [Alphaproteobacteria bacterium]|nr:N-acetylmuramoyl-L-alanine amidase [Alphaproteobacteria bacterium]